MGISPEDELGLSGGWEQAEQPWEASSFPREGQPSLRAASLTKSSASSGCAAVSSPKLCATCPGHDLFQVRRTEMSLLPQEFRITSPLHAQP